jgi:hypothetical protein
MRVRRVPRPTRESTRSLKEIVDEMMGSLVQNLNRNVLKDNPEQSDPQEDKNDNGKKECVAALHHRGDLILSTTRIMGYGPDSPQVNTTTDGNIL